MTICTDCNKEMTTAESCSLSEVKVDGKWYKRDTSYYDYRERCHDCGIVNKEGNIHHFGCDTERCPKCDEQIVFCDCKKEGFR